MLGRLIGVAVTTGTLAACASAPDTSVLSILGESRIVVGSPTELYTRIGRGALACWFGPAGPLKQDYLYHAEAEPPSRGGRSEILIHVREKLATNPRGVKAFTIMVEPNGESAELNVANLKVPEPLGQQLTTDVDRWAAGEVTCSANAARWTPVEEPVKAPARDLAVTKSKRP